MRLIKKWFTIGVAALAVATLPTVALAASQFNNPIEVVVGKAFGAIASEAGILGDFKRASPEAACNSLAQRVNEGQTTQKQADETIGRISSSQIIYDGTGIGTGAGNGASNGAGVAYVDTNGDGICDNAGTRTGDGLGAAFTDENGDGVCDNIGTGVRNGTSGNSSAVYGQGTNGNGRGLRDGSCVNR
jgi:hypothetical protein